MIYWRLDSRLYYHPPHTTPNLLFCSSCLDCRCPECSILNNGGRAQYKLLKGRAPPISTFLQKGHSSPLHTRANPGCTIQCTSLSVHSLLMILLDPPPFFMASYQKAKNWGLTQWIGHFDCPQENFNARSRLTWECWLHSHENGRMSMWHNSHSGAGSSYCLQGILCNPLHIKDIPLQINFYF